MTAEYRPPIDGMPGLSLHRKLAQVMYEAERIPKNGRAPKEMGGYPFVQVGDAADYIRKALAEKVITMMPTNVSVVGMQDRPTKSGGSMTTVDLLVEWTLTDGESGETITITSFGAGADGGDKYSGKATTNAMKYALLAGFLLSTGEDPELGAGEGRAPERNLRADHAANFSDGGLIGLAEKTDKKTGDYLVRESKEWGPFLGFRIKGEGRTGFLVEAHGPLATELFQREADVIGKRVQVWGEFAKRDLQNGGSYRAFVIERIRTPLFTIPAEEGAPEQAPQAQAADVADSSGTETRGTTTDPAPTVKDAQPDEAVVPDAAGASSAEPAAVPPGSDPTAICGAPSVYSDAERCGKPPHTARVNHTSYDKAGKATATW